MSHALNTTCMASELSVPCDVYFSQLCKSIRCAHQTRTANVRHAAQVAAQAPALQRFKAWVDGGWMFPAEQPDGGEFFFSPHHLSLLRQNANAVFHRCTLLLPSTICLSFPTPEQKLHSRLRASAGNQQHALIFLARLALLLDLPSWQDLHCF